MSALPTPSMTATILPAVGRAPRDVVVHGSRDWERKLGVTRIKQPFRCAACDGVGHNSRSRFCPARGLA